MHNTREGHTGKTKVPGPNILVFCSQTQVKTWVKVGVRPNSSPTLHGGLLRPGTSSAHSLCELKGIQHSKSGEL